ARRPAITQICSKPRSRIACAAAPANPARACGFSAPSRRGSFMLIASCSAPSSKAFGRLKREPIRGCRGRCGCSLPSTCRPGARDRGNVIHGAIGDFTEKYAKGLPDNPFDALMKLGEEKFAVLQDFPEARAFWWPRFVRIARWFVNFEKARRANASALFAEI